MIRRPKDNLKVSFASLICCFYGAFSAPFLNSTFFETGLKLASSKRLRETSFRSRKEAFAPAGRISLFFHLVGSPSFLTMNQFQDIFITFSNSLIRPSSIENTFFCLNPISFLGYSFSFRSNLAE